MLTFFSRPAKRGAIDVSAQVFDSVYVPCDDVAMLDQKPQDRAVAHTDNAKSQYMNYAPTETLRDARRIAEELIV